MRFIAEAEAVAALQHPNIVQIFETGRHNGVPYFTLEYVEGGTLGVWVRDQPLGAEQAGKSSNNWPAAWLMHMPKGSFIAISNRITSC